MLPILYGNDAAESALSLECMQWKVDYIAPGQRPYQVELATHRAKRKAAAAGRRKRVEGLRKAIGRARGRAQLQGQLVATEAVFSSTVLLPAGAGSRGHSVGAESTSSRTLLGSRGFPCRAVLLYAPQEGVSTRSVGCVEGIQSARRLAIPLPSPCIVVELTP